MAGSIRKLVNECFPHAMNLSTTDGVALGYTDILMEDNWTGDLQWLWVTNQKRTSFEQRQYMIP